MAERRAIKGPAPTHSRAEIGAAAVAIADRDGLPAVTMRGLAARLHTGAGALYRYVSSRDQVLDLMVDAAAAELELTAIGTGDWVPDLIELAHELRRLYRRHPWLADVRQRSSMPGPSVVAYFEHALGLLDPVPAGMQSKMEAIAMLTGIVTLFVQSERASNSVMLQGGTGGDNPRLAAALADDPALPTARPRGELFDRVVTGVLRGVLEIDDG